ncbi:hypothetical protein [Marinobacter nauticus]|uniref:Uncharacterized protein n=1 Tax=Marinobacter nauticus TaxID=2743 RepID=A0A368V765_MARNT|nr:hypothetical protein [Marinobacter nauticus]RBP74112.1 hypothetical protein DET64_105238 [Marinobacter nauticus]RCW34861.1 hypothetical protein DET51_105237 [Marinobacter nauticus]
MSYISIGALTVPLDSVLTFSQSYQAIERSTVHRLGVTGTGVKQTLYGGKLRTTISATGWTAPGLSALDRSAQHQLKCAATLSNSGGVSDIKIGDSSRRRTDAGFEPVAYAIFPGHHVKTPVSVDAAGNCVVTPVAGAGHYKVDWYPVLTVLIIDFTEDTQADTATFVWELVAEEV